MADRLRDLIDLVLDSLDAPADGASFAASRHTSKTINMWAWRTGCGN